MFEAIKYRWELQKLDKECNKIEKNFEKHKKGLSGEQLELLRAEVSSEIWPVFEKIDALKTRRFRQIANRLMVPLPESKDKELWKDLHYVQGRALTDKSFWELKICRLLNAFSNLRGYIRRKLVRVNESVHAQRFVLFSPFLELA